MAVELLCIVGGKDGSKPVQVRGRHITMFLSRPPFLNTLITITQSDRSFDKDWPGSTKGSLSLSRSSSIGYRNRATEDGDGWLNKLRDRLKSVQSRLRDGHADSLAYG